MSSCTYRLLKECAPVQTTQMNLDNLQRLQYTRLVYVQCYLVTHAWKHRIHHSDSCITIVYEGGTTHQAWLPRWTSLGSCVGQTVLIFVWSYTSNNIGDRVLSYATLSTRYYLPQSVYKILFTTICLQYIILPQSDSNILFTTICLQDFIYVIISWPVG